MSINKFTSTFQVLNTKTPILLHGAMHASWKRVGDDNDDDNDYDLVKVVSPWILEHECPYTFY